MSDPEVPAEPKSEPAPPPTPAPTPEASSFRLWALGLGVVAAMLLVWGIWQSFSLSRARSDAVANAERLEANGIALASRSAAAALLPLMSLKGQVPEVTDRTLQGIVQSILAQDGYRFVAITDASGKVLASSDLALIGKVLSLEGQTKAVADGWEASARIGDGDSNLGSIVLRTGK